VNGSANVGSVGKSGSMGPEATSWLLFLAVLVNQSGRVMIPSVKTSVLADPEFGPAFQTSVGALLSGVSIVCLGGKLLGAAFTDRLGGWTVLVCVFAMWIAATLGAVVTSSVDVFGVMWLLNSFAYTITWGAAVQVVGASYGEADRPAQLSKVASASRFGATLGNIFFGQLLSSGMHWRSVLIPLIPLQALLLLLCGYKYWADSAAAVPAKLPASKDAPPPAADPPPSVVSALLSLDMWLMLVPKALIFTYTQVSRPEA
jgi:MFS family permease